MVQCGNELSSWQLRDTCAQGHCVPDTRARTEGRRAAALSRAGAEGVRDEEKPSPGRVCRRRWASAPHSRGLSAALLCSERPLPAARPSASKRKKAGQGVPRICCAAGAFHPKQLICQRGCHALNAFAFAGETRLLLKRAGVAQWVGHCPRHGGSLVRSPVRAQPGCRFNPQ